MTNILVSEFLNMESVNNEDRLPIPQTRVRFFFKLTIQKTARSQQLGKDSGGG